MISVLIPLYNVEKYIARCLESILSQTFQDFEIIVVNDSTLDKSAEIVKFYMTLDDRISLINNETNMGLAWTRFVGYSNAKGDYYVFCDSDDFFPHDALEILHNSIKKSNADIVCANYQVAYSKDSLGSKSNNRARYGSDAKSIYRSLLTDELSHSLCAKIYKKNIFKDFNYITNKGMINAEDAFLFYQILQNVNNVIVIPDVVYYYYQNIESSTKVKLTDNALRNIVSFWNLRDSLMQNEKILYDLSIERFIKNYCNIIKKGGNKKVLNSCIKISNFKKHITIYNVFKYNTFPSTIKVIFNLKLQSVFK